MLPQRRALKARSTTAAIAALTLVTLLLLGPYAAAGDASPSAPALSAAGAGPTIAQAARPAGPGPTVVVAASARRSPARALRRGTCVVLVRARAGVKRVVVRLDGRVIARYGGRRSRTARLRCATRPQRLAPGRHVLRVVVRDRAGRSGQAKVAFVIRSSAGASPPVASPPAASRPVAPPTPPTSAAQVVRWDWFADFSTGDFTQWSWWGQGQSHMWGTISVTSPASQGIPAPPVGSPDHVARMAVTSADAAAGRIHAKLYKGFREGDRSPANVSGRYSAWFYIPSSYRVPRGTDANIFQFKEDAGNGSQPLWWVQLSTGSWAKGMGGATWIGPRPTGAEQPVLVLNNPRKDWRRPVFMTAPLDRWFEVRADLRQGDRIEVTIDGRLFDIARASEYPVSPFRDGSREWTFGVGNYTRAPDTVLYIGGAGYARS